ncbi:MAG: hypothetical protein OEX00_09060, partial [Gammaproteobacteria bacterium]|nr:hypothetical protein [Gammaproteobacteria bacterium]
MDTLKQLWYRLTCPPQTMEDEWLRMRFSFVASLLVVLVISLFFTTLLQIIVIPGDQHILLRGIFMLSFLCLGLLFNRTGNLKFSTVITYITPIIYGYYGAIQNDILSIGFTVVGIILAALISTIRTTSVVA